MKKHINKFSNKFIVAVLMMCLFTAMFLSSICVTDVSASAYKKYNAATDIDYTNGEGKNVVLTHTEKKEAELASYEINDSRLTRNATFYMSMNVKFSKSWSWAIQLRNVTCDIKGKSVTGNMTFRLFGNQGTMLVDDYGIDNWPSFKKIDDKKWHEVTVKSTPTSFEIWIDGVKGKKLYYMSSVSNMTTNYVCPAVSMTGYNTGTVKNIKIWNDGKKENPVMPADRVTQSIESLPDVIALKASDLARVNGVLSAYNNLSDKEKKYVINHDKLELLVKALPKFQNSYSLKVEGKKTGKFQEVFPEGIISHRKTEGRQRFEFDTALSRKSTFYMNCVVNMSKDSNCFDIILRKESYKVDGKDVEANLSIRIFTHGALLIDSESNEMSEWCQFKKELFTGSHIVAVESRPNYCALWIDNQKYEIEGMHKNVSGAINSISARPGIYLSEEPEGTISNIQVWNDGNRSGENIYSVGDAERVAIYNLPELNELSLNDEGAVKRARSMYNRLSEEDRKYVTNIDKLESVERSIKFIKEKGEIAYLFLRDELPEVKKNYVNLISTAKPEIMPEFNQMVSYNSSTYELKFTNSEEYIQIPFKGLQGIGADDTYLIKFVYKPYEYYYETETASWMGLRVTFSGYEVGGNGAKFVNRNQFVFFVTQCGLIERANSQSMPDKYITTFVPELNKEHHVSMLCEQGKMKVWVNGKPVTYLDELPDYPFSLGFEGSRCKCDVTNIQVYNLSNPTVTESVDDKEGGFKFVEDLLYGKEGKTSNGDVNRSKAVMVTVISITAISIITILAVIVVIALRKRKKRGVINNEE